MTDDELKALVASLAKSQAETSKQMKETDLKMKESYDRQVSLYEKLSLQMKDTDRKIEETAQQIKKLNEETTLQMKETDRKIEETAQQIKKLNEETTLQMKETDRKIEETAQQIKKLNEETTLQMKETALQMKETDRKLKSLGVQLGGISSNNGLIAEEYFFNSLESKMLFAGERYDDIQRNIKSKSNNLCAEFDIVLYNGKSIAIIEVKSKAHTTDLEAILQQAKNFRFLFPTYHDYSIYLGLASLSFYPQLEEQARTLGIAILKQKGDIMEVSDTCLTAY